MTRIDTEKIENSKVRRHWDENSSQYLFSIVDIIAIITNSSDPRNYWKVLKSRLKNTQKELVTKCNQLKMKANDGKSYLTDTADSDTILQIIKLVSKDDVRIFDLWFEQKEKEKRESHPQNGTSNLAKNNSNNFQNSIEKESYPQPEAELLIDAYQTDKNIFISAFVAGVSESNLSISISTSEVTIRGIREQKNDTSKSNKDIEELYWGTFSRNITLPEEIDIEKSEAKNSNGFLQIKLPKINKSIRKKVEINFL